MADEPGFDAQQGLLDALKGYEGRWSAQPIDRDGNWWAIKDEDGRAMAECQGEYDAKYLALLVNAHEAAVMVPGEVDHMLRLALVGQRHEQYHMDAEFHAFVHLLAGILPRLVSEYASGDRPKVEAHLKNFLAGLIQ